MKNKKKNEKEINNHVFLMDTIADLYRSKHRVSMDRFLKICRRTKLLEYICENSFVFDGLPNEELLSEAEAYIKEKLCG